MYQKERMEEILSILRRNGYVTVKFLVEELHYSNATINRDLKLLERQKLINRSYGGVELAEQKGVPLPFRYHKMKAEKNKISQKAAELVEDGDTVFIDATTTTEYMQRYLIDRKNLTVITNNMSLAEFLSAYDITVICLGGRVVERPCMLCGDETVENAQRFHVDKMFFASASITTDGKIGGGDLYYPLYSVMTENADRIYYLADHEKVDAPYTKILCRFPDLTGIITDYEFNEELKEKYKNTEFIEV